MMQKAKDIICVLIFPVIPRLPGGYFYSPFSFPPFEWMNEILGAVLLRTDNQIRVPLLIGILRFIDWYIAVY